MEFNRVTDYYVKCVHCDKLFAEYLTRPWSELCPRCKKRNSRGERPAIFYHVPAKVL